jgi:arsenate reductase (thioredoxin)
MPGEMTVAHHPYNVLFMCTGNSARSILAEALTNNLSLTAGRLKGFSAGSHPKETPNPFALGLLHQNGLPTEELRSKSWDEFAQPNAPALDFVLRYATRLQASNALTGQVRP